MPPVVGQDAGGPGSTNSGGSRSSSEYSLTRSTATLREKLSDGYRERRFGILPLPVQGRQIVEP
jgi:hypothetical protein